MGIMYILRLYGFPKHGYVDGFSRTALWLKVSLTNNDPVVVAGFYLETVENKGGCPVNLDPRAPLFRA